VLIAASALAQDFYFDCTTLEALAQDGNYVYPEEEEWYAENCKEEDDDDDDEELGELIDTQAISLPQAGNPPKVETCLTLPSSVVVTTSSPHVQCRRLDAAGVANAELIAQGILDAVDVQGWVEVPMQVCFSRQGRLLFLDASTAPRLQSNLAVENINGLTCGMIDRVGTVVLLQGAVAQAGESGESIAVPPPEPAAEAYRVSNCELTTTDDLSLRAGPSVNYARLDIIPNATSLAATARNGNWFLLEFEQRRGWASADYGTLSASCDVAGDSIDTYLAIRAPGARTLTDCDLWAGDIINLRLGPGLDHDIAAEIPFRTNLIATERSDDWFKVEYNDIMGWVNIDYVFRNGACG